MRKLSGNEKARERGFTLIEMLLVIAILATVTGGIFLQLNTAQQRINTEQTKVDNFDQARDFVDQFFRDINQIGYPNGRMLSFLPANNLPLAQQDTRLAVGLVKIDSKSIWFEGDINGTGVVQEVQYQINGSGTCPLCFQRSAVPKVDGTGQLAQFAIADWGTEVNDLITPTIFTYFDANGAQIITVPADIASNPTALARVKTIHISLTIQNNQVMD